MNCRDIMHNTGTYVNLMNVIYYNWNKSILIFLLYEEVFIETTFLGLRLVIKRREGDNSAVDFLILFD